MKEPRANASPGSGAGSSTASVAEAVRPSRVRSMLLHLTLVAFAIALLVRAGQVQIVQGAAWEARADGQHMRVDSIAAPRGAITDARGVPLTVSREQVQLVISPNQVRPTTARRNDRDSLARGLARLGVSRAVVRKALDSTRKYVQVPGLFTRSEAAPLMRLRGVTASWTMERLPSGAEGLTRLIGSVNRDGVAQSGLELALDPVLAGTQGARRSVRDVRGRMWDSPVGSTVQARAGDTVRLTINLQLQEIIERELLAAVARTGASGGDIVVLDPDDGAILAMAGARNGRIAPSVTPLTQSYQPGSVLKPFFVARLMDEGKVRPSDMVNTEGGRWMLGSRPITDEHKRDYMSVFDVVRWSSNIGTIKLVTEHMTPAEEYELLRDYGFGTFTALPYPSESRGTLREPSLWTVPSAASHAIGYELAVTPVQLAVAYAAIANGGEVLEPAVVREIRDADGKVRYVHQRRALRRVATEESMREVRAMLKAVVDSGTGKAAGLTVFDVGGKSGTARINQSDNSREYDATFAGMFPMADPQMVVVARLLEPQSQIFGGVVAGPMVRAVLNGALAARDAALDRAALARVARSLPTPEPTDARRQESARDADARADLEVEVVAAPSEVVPSPGRVVVSLPLVPDTTRATALPARPVPPVRGLTLREAVRTLHAAGFRVRMSAGGVSGRTRPAAGTSARAGATIVLEQGS